MTIGCIERSYLTHLKSSFQELINVESLQTVIYNNSQGADELVKIPIYHSRTKHIDVRHRFVRGAYVQ